MGTNHLPMDKDGDVNREPKDKKVYTIGGLFAADQNKFFQAFYFRCGEPKVSLEMHEREPQIQATCLCNADFEGKTSVDVTLDILSFLLLRVQRHRQSENQKVSIN